MLSKAKGESAAVVVIYRFQFIGLPMVNISWLDTQTQLMGMSAVTLILAASGLRNWMQTAISYYRSALEEADMKRTL